MTDISLFQTREQFNEWKRDIKEFTSRKNDRFQFVKNKRGTSASKADLKFIAEHEQKVKEMFERKIEEQKDKPFYVNGKMVGTQEFKSLWLSNPNIGGYYKWKPFEWDKVTSKETVKNRIKRLKTVLKPNYFEKRTNDMKTNFMNSIAFSFNSEAEKVLDMLKSLPPDDFYELFQMHGDVFDFNLYASENSGGASDIDDLLKMQEYLEDFFQGRTDMDLKGF